MGNSADPETIRPVGLILQTQYKFLPEIILDEILEMCAAINDPCWFDSSWPCDRFCEFHLICTEAFGRRMENTDSDIEIVQSFEEWMMN